MLGASPVTPQLGTGSATLHLNSHRHQRDIVPNFRRDSREPLFILHRNQVPNLGRLSETLSNHRTKLDPTSTTVLTVGSFSLPCNCRSAQKYNLTSPFIPSEVRKLVTNYNAIKGNIGNL